MKSFSKYFEAVKYVEHLQNIAKRDVLFERTHPEIYLKRTKYFLELAGNPERKFKFVHITGTSGKGTVSTMIQKMLSHSGKKTGLYASPFCTTCIEKISVGEKYIAPEDFVSIVNRLKKIIARTAKNGKYKRPTYFEMFLIIALLYFEKQKCEWVVLEAGCGGRFDSSNIIKSPAVVAITNVNLDHTEIIGKTLAKIAFEKAGIIKRSSAFFTTEKRPAILKIFQKACDEKEVKMNLIKVSNIQSLAKYRSANINLATAIGKYLKVSEANIEKGIRDTRLPCRFEIMQNNPQVVLDGAHNVSKMESVSENLERLKYRKLLLIIAISAKKDLEGIMEIIASKADYIFVTQFESIKSFSPDEIAAVSDKYKKKNVKLNIFANPFDALNKALGLAKKDDLVLATGSFHLTGKLRKFWYPEKTVLKRRSSF